MEALDSIEKRIDQLTRILGEMPSEETGSKETLSDSLLSANTLLSSAMSGREKIAEVVNRSAELEHYLDPSFLDEKQEIKAKEVYVNTVAPELAENFETLEDIKNLEPTLGAEYFRSIPDVTDKLKEMNESTGELSQKNDLLEESLTLAMQRYDEIQSSIKDSLKAMNERIDQIENRLKNKKKPDVDVWRGRREFNGFFYL